MIRRRLTRRVAAIALTVVSVLVAAGASLSATKATPAPILLGNISTVENPAINASDMVNSTKAWIAYINRKYGGVKGHKIQLLTCDDRGNPALSIQCANNLLEKKVVGFVGEWSIVFGANALATVEQAKVPIFGGLTITEQQWSSKYVFPVTPGSAGSYPALAVAMRSKGVKNLAGIFFNTPAAIVTSDQVAAQWPGLGGNKYSPLYFAPTAPDLTPVAASAVRTGANGIFLGTSASAAVRLLQALRNTGYHGITGMTGVAATPDVYRAAGSDLDGAYITEQGVTIGKKTADQKLYQLIMGRAKIPADTLSLTGVSGMQYLYDVLKSIKGPITRQTLLAGARKHLKWKGFLTHPMDPKFAPKQFPALRNPYTTIVRYITKGRRQALKISGYKKYTSVVGGVTYVSGFPRGS